MHKHTFTGGGGKLTFVSAVNNFIKGVSPMSSDFVQQITTMVDLRFFEAVLTDIHVFTDVSHCRLEDVT